MPKLKNDGKILDTAHTDMLGMARVQFKDAESKRGPNSGTGARASNFPRVPVPIM
jgi:hypothetical protein